MPATVHSLAAPPLRSVPGEVIQAPVAHVHVRKELRPTTGTGLEAIPLHKDATPAVHVPLGHLVASLLIGNHASVTYPARPRRPSGQSGLRGRAIAQPSSVSRGRAGPRAPTPRARAAAPSTKRGHDRPRPPSRRQWHSACQTCGPTSNPAEGPARPPRHGARSQAGRGRAPTTF